METEDFPRGPEPDDASPEGGDFAKRRKRARRRSKQRVADLESVPVAQKGLDLQTCQAWDSFCGLAVEFVVVVVAFSGYQVLGYGD